MCDTLIEPACAVVSHVVASATASAAGDVLSGLADGISGGVRWAVQNTAAWGVTIPSPNPGTEPAVTANPARLLPGTAAVPGAAMVPGGGRVDRAGDPSLDPQDHLLDARAHLLQARRGGGVRGRVHHDRLWPGPADGADGLRHAAAVGDRAACLDEVLHLDHRHDRRIRERAPAARRRRGRRGRGWHDAVTWGRRRRACAGPRPLSDYPAGLPARRWSAWSAGQPSRPAARPARPARQQRPARYRPYRHHGNYSPRPPTCRPHRSSSRRDGRDRR